MKIKDIVTTLTLVVLSASVCSAQNNSRKGPTDNYSVPLSKSYHMYALVNGWKIYKDKDGYTVMFPKNIKDGVRT
jgi:hypothetical protein